MFFAIYQALFLQAAAADFQTSLLSSDRSNIPTFLLYNASFVATSLSICMASPSSLVVADSLSHSEIRHSFIAIPFGSTPLLNCSGGKVSLKAIVFQIQTISGVTLIYSSTPTSISVSSVSLANIRVPDSSSFFGSRGSIAGISNVLFQNISFTKSVSHSENYHSYGAAVQHCNFIGCSAIFSHLIPLLSEPGTLCRSTNNTYMQTNANQSENVTIRDLDSTFRFDLFNSTGLQFNCSSACYQHKVNECLFTGSRLSSALSAELSNSTISFYKVQFIATTSTYACYLSDAHCAASQCNFTSCGVSVISDGALGLTSSSLILASSTFTDCSGSTAALELRYPTADAYITGCLFTHCTASSLGVVFLAWAYEPVTHYMTCCGFSGCTGYNLLMGYYQVSLNYKDVFSDSPSKDQIHINSSNADTHTFTSSTSPIDDAESAYEAAHTPNSTSLLHSLHPHSQSLVSPTATIQRPVPPRSSSLL